MKLNQNFSLILDDTEDEEDIPHQLHDYLKIINNIKPDTLVASRLNRLYYQDYRWDTKLISGDYTDEDFTDFFLAAQGIIAQSLDKPDGNTDRSYRSYLYQLTSINMWRKEIQGDIERQDYYSAYMKLQSQFGSTVVDHWFKSHNFKRASTALGYITDQLEIGVQRPSDKATLVTKIQELRYLHDVKTPYVSGMLDDQVRSFDTDDIQHLFQDLAPSAAKLSTNHQKH